MFPSSFFECFFAIFYRKLPSSFSQFFLPRFLSVSFLFFCKSFLHLFFPWFLPCFLSVSFLFFIRCFLPFFSNVYFLIFLRVSFIICYEKFPFSFFAMLPSSFFWQFPSNVFFKNFFPLFFSVSFLFFFKVPSDNWNVFFKLYIMKEIFNRVDVSEREYNKIKVSNSVISNSEESATGDYVIWLLFSFFLTIQEGVTSGRI